MSHTGQKRYQTPTFDYLRFHSYMQYIEYTTYRISKDSDLRKIDKVNEFIERFKKLMTDDYSEDQWYSERQMQKHIKEINEKYTIVE